MNKLFHILVGCLLVAILCTVVACTDDDSFTSSSSNRLTFSTDTIKMDTVFSQVPTPTKDFWVYNRSGDGLRCRNVRLRNGNQSGFRVNVDGVYLGSESGYQTSDIEVRDKDSIRVFVELTSPQNGSDEPEFLEKSEESVIEAQVEITELMGNEIYLYLTIEGTSCVARVDPSSTAEAGESIEVALDVEKIHIFDKETERTITN